MQLPLEAQALTIKQAAGALQVSERTIKRYRASGVLPKSKRLGVARIPLSAITALLAQKGIVTPEEITARIAVTDAANPGQGARMVAKAWVDTAYRALMLEDGSKAVGLFNRGYGAANVTVNWSVLGLAGKQKVRDLWRQQDLGQFGDNFTTEVPRHGVVLIRVWPVK